MSSEPIGPSPSAPDRAGGGQIGFLLLLALGFVALADWLFWDQPVGWTVGAYGLLALAVVACWERRLPLRRGLLPIALTLAVLCLQCVEQPNALTITCGLLGLATVAIGLREGGSHSALVWLQRWGLLVALGWRCGPDDLIRWNRSLRQSGAGRWSVEGLVHNWALPVSLGAAFAALFWAANPVLHNWMSAAWRAVNEFARHLLEDVPSFWRVAMWIGMGAAAWALLRFRSGRADATTVEHPTAAAPSAAFPPGAVLVRSLMVFNALFAVQTILDVLYLWGGTQLPDGLTYAEYAHRGAYPLVAAAILAGLFVLFAFRGDPRDVTLRRARGLTYVWLAQNLLLVVSALWRLRLYVEAYTLTRWRVGAVIWMMLVFSGLAWILVRIGTRRSNLWLVNANVLTTVVVLIVSCLVDFDALIARFNVAHCREVAGTGPPIDLAYLEHLGPEALPALLTLVGVVDGTPAEEEVCQRILRLRSALRDQLASWRGWTWRRHRLAELALLPDARSSAAPSRTLTKR